MVKSLIDKVREQYVFASNKHGLHFECGFDTAEEFADMQINKMDNVSLLQAISDALEEE